MCPDMSVSVCLLSYCVCVVSEFMLNSHSNRPAPVHSYKQFASSSLSIGSIKSGLNSITHSTLHQPKWPLRQQSRDRAMRVGNARKMTRGLPTRPRTGRDSALSFRRARRTLCCSPLQASVCVASRLTGRLTLPSTCQSRYWRCYYPFHLPKPERDRGCNVAVFEYARSLSGPIIMQINTHRTFLSNTNPGVWRHITDPTVTMRRVSNYDNATVMRVATCHLNHLARAR